MPRLTHSFPSYRLHRASGQAIITLEGQDHYLGPFGSATSYEARDRLMALWLAGGRRLPSPAPLSSCLRLKELVARYWVFAKSYYAKDGEPTGEVAVIKSALRRLCVLYAELPASELSPLALGQLQQAMTPENLARTYINKQIQIIRRMYRWGVSQELVPVATYQALACMPGLKRGRTAARETKPVQPVSDAVVEQTLPKLHPVVADMVRLQRLIGCRPEEVWMLRPMDIVEEGDIWWYTPSRHKTEHHGHDRKIAIGPRAQ